MLFEDTPVLVVEDREENRRAAAEFFTSINVPVVFATCFQQAKNLMESKTIFRACIFDIEIPENDGDEPTVHGKELTDLTNTTYNSIYMFASGGIGIAHGNEQVYLGTFWRTCTSGKSSDWLNDTNKTMVEAWKEIWQKLWEYNPEETARNLFNVKIEVWSTPAQG